MCLYLEGLWVRCGPSCGGSIGLSGRCGCHKNERWTSKQLQYCIILNYTTLHRTNFLIFTSYFPSSLTLHLFLFSFFSVCFCTVLKCSTIMPPFSFSYLFIPTKPYVFYINILYSNISSCLSGEGFAPRRSWHWC